mgnify:CR=1 FL=1|tara:strand:+ start:2579 stop:3262 length:684 start_codon:yes stop_codon:yes gene_type:complete
MQKNIRVFIFARGGSKGIHKKNIQKIANIPLVGHSILTAYKLKNIEKIYVSTDCCEIADISRKYGAEIIMRPEPLATDNAPELMAWKHAIKESINKDGDFNVFVSLPPTSPLRNTNDVLTCISSLKNEVDIVLTMTRSKRNPWFNMVKSDKDNQISLINRNFSIFRRQDAPNCYDVATVAYAAKKEYILSTDSIWNGNVVGVEIPEERSIDIDSPVDLKIAKLLFEE